MPACPRHDDDQTTADDYLRFALTSACRHAHAGAAADHNAGAAPTGTFTGSGMGLGKSGYPDDTQHVAAALELMARALYFQHNMGARKLLSELHVWPMFLRELRDGPPQSKWMTDYVRERLQEDMLTAPMHGLRPEILKFQVIEEDDLAVVNMLFFGQHQACVMGERSGLRAGQRPEGSRAAER